jgi:glycosyltransferase involved in cell wall biosynthesis
VAAPRIFHLCADPGVAPDGAKGASAHLRALHLALRRRGADVVLFAARAPADPAALPFRVLPLAALEAEARRGGPPDLVLERYALGAASGLAFARAVGAAHLLEVNAPLVSEARLHRPGSVSAGDDAVERRLWAESDLVCVVSTPLAELVRSVRGPDAPVLVLQNGFDDELFAALPPRPAAVAGRGEFAFLGRPRPWHGAERLPPLIAALRATGRDARLAVIGGGPGADAVAAAADGAGVREHAEFTGDLPQGDAIRRFAQADVAVAPYPPLERFYFSPLKVVEAMAAGLPVVATAQGDLPAVVGDAGLLVAPDDDAGFLAACRRLLDEPELRLELGRRGRRRALDGMSWDSVAARLLSAASARRPAGTPLG